MLSYQHIYHAGNHADVLKHAVLVLVLQALQRKATPLRVFDAHAGAGRYDLNAAAARRTAEADGGIRRLLGAPPPVLEAYLATVRSLNPDGRLGHYPGSPWLVAQLLRPDDHLTLFELHPQALTQLRAVFRGKRRVHIHAADSYSALPGLLPPPERRGLVLIDPSYELRDEYRKALRLLQNAYRRWPSGVYVIWYPLIRRPDAAAFPQAVAGAGIPRLWRCELDVLGSGYAGMRGSGMLVVNLPWGLEPVLSELLPRLWQSLSDGAGGWLAEWLVPEQPS